MTQPLTYAAPLDPDRSRSTQWLRRLGPLAGLLVVVTLFWILRPRTFPTTGNLQLMLIQTAVVATAALGMTLIIVSGGIDLSVASTIACVTMIVATLMNWHWSPLMAALGGIAAAGIYGV